MFIETLCSHIKNSHSKGVKEALEASWILQNDEKFFEDIVDTNIYSLSSKNKYGEIIISSAVYGKGILLDRYNSDQIIDRDSRDRFVFDYTMERDEDIQKVVKQFEELRDTIFNEHPDAKIHIAQRIIAVDYGENPSFYCVVDDEIIPMKITGKEKIQVTPGEKEEEEKELISVDIKSNPISNIIAKLKVKWHSIKSRKDVRIPVNYQDDIPGQISLQVEHSDNIVSRSMKKRSTNLSYSDEIMKESQHEKKQSETKQTSNSFDQYR